MVLVAVLVLSAIAAVTYDGVPGDQFYFAKRVAERPAGLVDHDLMASNRLAELEELVARDAEPRLILPARADAARAVVDRPVDDELFKTFSLLAWPGGLSELGLDVFTPAQALVVPASEWQDAGSYRSTLLDGNLVTVSANGDQLVISASGKWRSTRTVNGWKLSNPQLDHAYDVERVAGGLRVQSGTSAATERSEPTDDQAAPDPKQGIGTITGGDDNESGAAAVSDDSQPSTPGTSPEETADPSRNPNLGEEADPTSSSSTSTSVTDRTSQPEASSTSPANTEDVPPPAPNDPQPSTTPTTAATTTSATTPATSSWVIYLRNPGDGNTSSSGTLAMAPGASPGGALANFDTNRDGAPGLLIQKDGAGLSGNDSSKIQRWRWVTTSASSVTGQGSLAIWLAAKDFKTDEQIGVTASLELCAPGCVQLGTAQWSGQGTGGFQQAKLNFGSINRQIPEGAELRLKIAVPDGLATTDVWFAYDAGSYPSRINLG